MCGGVKAAETYVAQRPRANANTSPHSGQINCFLSRLLLFGLTAPHIGGLVLPGGINQTDAHACAAPHVHIHTHTYTRRLFAPAFRRLSCLPLCYVQVRARTCALAGLQRMNQQVLTHASESGLPAGLPALMGRGGRRKRKKRKEKKIHQ